jgi:hypothetical protein
MKAVARLVYTYFAATPLTRGLAIVGLIVMTSGMVGYLYFPIWTLGSGNYTRTPLWLQSVILSAAPLGLMLLFSSITLLPRIVERFALGRLICVLPGARLGILVSVAVTAGGIALLTATGVTLAFYYFPSPLKPESVFARTFATAFADLSLLLAALWIVAKTRGIWLVVGSVLIVLGVTSGLAFIGRPSGVSALVSVGALAWVAFGAVLTAGAKLRHRLARPRAALKRLLAHIVPSPAYTEGSELQWLLGTSRPWVVALGQALPVAVAAGAMRQNVVWLFNLTLLSGISGAITSMAATRSRALWLHYGWTREELFRRVEAGYWRYNAHSLGVLLLLFVAIGAYLELPTPVLALGLALLALGSIVSAYLGLTMTRGLRAAETVAGIATMGLMLFAAVAVADANIGRVVTLELGLVALAAGYRTIAIARWKGLDWMLCRRPVSARGAS